MADATVTDDVLARARDCSDRASARAGVVVRALDTDDKYSFTFTTPGVYEYFCSMHPHMKATIVVEAGQSR